MASESSHCQSVKARVPQGSILGPLCSINDIEDKIDSNMFLFADDSSLLGSYCNANDAENILNND